MHRRRKEGREGGLDLVEARDLADDLGDLGHGVALGVQDRAGCSTHAEGGHTTNHNDGCLPGLPGWLHSGGALVGSVGEVVVSGAHVVVGAWVGHLDEGSGETGASSIEDHAVLQVLVDVVNVSILVGKKLVIGLAVDLVDVGHTLTEVVVLEEDLVLGQLGLVEGVVRGHVGNLNDVATVSLGSSVTLGISVVGVTSSPLDFYKR